MRHALSRIHFVGIGGAGMSGIAEVLHQQGFVVSGSDAHDSPAIARLRQLGLRVHVGHAAAHVADAQAVVVSSAIAPDNPEVAAARARQLPVVPRAAMLAELMRARLGVAVAGTHGKTTTSSLLTHVLLAAGLDPGFVIGGQLLDAGVGARAGRGDVLVAEADESDASFLHLSPLLAVVTNIDADHMETYGHSLDRLHQAFIDFLHRLPFYGTAVVCGDDPGVQAIAARVQRPLLRVGLGEGMDLVARRLQPGPGARMHFVAEQSGHDPLPLSLALAGTHNVRNALAVLAVARLLGVPDGVTRQALASFGGVGRRFQHRGELRSADGGAATLIDDYGHHPMEVAAVLAAARGAYPGRRLVLAFQPHRYTRTRDCMDTFAAVLGQADVLWLTEVYAAGEEPIAGADGAALARAVRAADQVEPSFAADLDGLVEGLAGELRDGDVVLSLGAGSISALPDRLIRRLGTAQSETT